MANIISTGIPQSIQILVAISPKNSADLKSRFYNGDYIVAIVKDTVVNGQFGWCCREPLSKITT